MKQAIPTIGVFDSGVGGLTVLSALLTQASAADYLYLGDTARLPYGSKSQATVARYAVSSAHFLVEQGADALVIACNTASALALDALRAAVEIPVIGVIETGATAALQSSRTKDVMVIATAATVESHAYSSACRELGLRAIEKACPLLVPLVEEGWIEHPVTREVTAIYLDDLLSHATQGGMTADTLVLGCTHYPLLRGVIEETLGDHDGGRAVRVIDSAHVTAEQVAARLALESSALREPRVRFYATDSVAKFRSLGTRFLGRAVDGVELIDLGG
ncbi:MAG TPA: glutamate racemase [Acidobacteriaceae bacterium]|jgi:glutamate racemase|nr:glutamate racemase [Acidobacteriaceae bacterium]